MTLGPGQYALIASGGLLAASGLWLLLANRARAKSVPLHIADSRGVPFPSQSTRVVAALVLLIGGYHLVIWSFPTWLSAVQLNRNIWYVWILIGIVAICGSLLMDRADQKNPSDGGDGAP